MRNIKNLVKALALTGLVGLSFAASAPKIGVVNYMDVFKVVPQGQATLASMINALKPKIDALKTQQAKLQMEAVDLQKNAPTLTKAQLADQQKALSVEQEAFQKKVDALRQDQMQEEQTAQTTFETDLTNAVDQVAASGHYDMILNSQAAPYYSPALDVSAQVEAVMSKAASAKATQPAK